MRYLYGYDKVGRLTLQQQITDPLGTPLTKTLSYQWQTGDRLTHVEINAMTKINLIKRTIKRR